MKKKTLNQLWSLKMPQSLFISSTFDENICEDK